MSKRQPTNRPAPARKAKGTTQTPAATAAPDTNETTAAPDTPNEPTASAGDTGIMTITLTKSTAPRKDPRVVIFNGPLHAVQFLRTAFGETIPDTLTVSGEFAEPKEAKPKETKEERKARLAALPKPTLEEKIAKKEAEAARLRAKLASAAAQPAQPSA